MSRRRSFETVLVLVSLAIAHPEGAAAQSTLYLGSAEGFRAEGNGLVGAVAPPPPEVGAGGSLVDSRKICHITEILCFDEIAAGSGSAGVLTVGDVQTIGGARDEGGTARPGFPRVDSLVSGTLLRVPGVLQVATGSGRASADAETGELSAELGGAVITLGTGQVIPLSEGEEVDLGIATIFGGSSRIIEDGGLKVIEIETGRMESETLGNATFGRAAAGLELASTSGGSFAGSDGCGVTPGDAAADGALVLGCLALLAAALRRRRH